MTTAAAKSTPAKKPRWKPREDGKCLGCGKRPSRKDLIIVRDSELRRVCSDICLETLRRMEIMSEHGIDPLNAASDAAGQYLEAIRKTDLAALSHEQWMTLLAIIVHAWSDAMSKGETPF